MTKRTSEQLEHGLSPQQLETLRVLLAVGGSMGEPGKAAGVYGHRPDGSGVFIPPGTCRAMERAGVVRMVRAPLCTRLELTPRGEEIAREFSGAQVATSTGVVVHVAGRRVRMTRESYDALRAVANHGSLVWEDATKSWEGHSKAAVRALAREAMVIVIPKVLVQVTDEGMSVLSGRVG